MRDWIDYRERDASFAELARKYSHAKGPQINTTPARSTLATSLAYAPPLLETSYFYTFHTFTESMKSPSRVAWPPIKLAQGLPRMPPARPG